MTFPALSSHKFLYFLTAPIIRLSEGMHGRVEIKFEDEWGAICTPYLSSNTATVICRQLGLRGGSSITLFSETPASYRYWINNPSCFANDETVWSCQNSGWNITRRQCSATSLKGVQCTANGKRLLVMDAFPKCVISRMHTGYFTFLHRETIYL